MRDVHAEFRAAHAASLVEMAALGLRPVAARAGGGSSGRVVAKNEPGDAEAGAVAAEQNETLESAFESLDLPGEAPDLLKAGRFSPPLAWLRWESMGLADWMSWSRTACSRLETEIMPPRVAGSARIA